MLCFGPFVIHHIYKCYCIIIQAKHLTSLYLQMTTLSSAIKMVLKDSESKNWYIYK